MKQRKSSVALYGTPPGKTTLSFKKTDGKGEDAPVLASYAVTINGGNAVACLQTLVSATNVPELRAGVESLAGHLIGTSVPVWFRGAFPKGFAGTMVQALSAYTPKKATAESVAKAEERGFNRAALTALDNLILKGRSDEFILEVLEDQYPKMFNTAFVKERRTEIEREKAESEPEEEGAESESESEEAEPEEKAEPAPEPKPNKKQKK